MARDGAPCPSLLSTKCGPHCASGQQPMYVRARSAARTEASARLSIPESSAMRKLTFAGRQFGAGRGTAWLARLLAMQIKPFRIEQYFGKYEFTAKYLLSSSDAESRTIQELLELEPGAQEKFLQHWCGYTESPGAPALRGVIAGIYRAIEPKDVLVVAAAEEAIFVLYHALISPGDHVSVEPPACEIYERAVSLGSMSKTYGLPGLRLGWLVCKDAEILQRCLEFRYYTTICNSAPSEFLTVLALRHREVLIRRNRGIVLRNMALL